METDSPAGGVDERPGDGVPASRRDGVDERLGGGVDHRHRSRVEELYASDAQVLAARPLAEVRAALRTPGLSLERILATIMEGYADRPALGERATELVADPATGRTAPRLADRYDTVSYRELWSRAGALAAAWHHHPEFPLRPGEFVCVLGFTGTDYVTIELACVRAGAVSVPLQASTTVAHLASVLAETGAPVIAVSAELLPVAVEGALASASLRRLVVFDCHAGAGERRAAVETARRRLAPSGSPVLIDSLANLVARGAGLPPAAVEPGPDDDRLVSVIYTSGSTGTPKGAMFPARLAKMAWRAGFWPSSDDLPVISFNCLPMSHVSARATLAGTLAAGGTCLFAATSDLATLFDDLALARPTALRLVPRLCDLLFQRYHSELDRRTAGPGERAALEADVRRELRERVLGGRLLWIGTGSAPLSAEMAAFVESCAQLPVHDGYGSTEAGRILVDGKVARPPVLDFKLVDVPELGYLSTDRPHPRGELLVRTAAIIPGYYRRPELAAEIFDGDGFYRTGDIMAQTGPDELVYIDRRASVLKLSQGEFVALSRLEALFVTNPLIHQIFVHGSSEHAYLLAVVVPSPLAVDQCAAAGGLGELIGDALRRTAADAGLRPFEIPRDVLIEPEPFSTAGGLLSDAGKLLRPRLRARYGERLERRYAELAAREAGAVSVLRRAGRDQPVLDAVLRAAEAVLGDTAGPVHPEVRFVDLGGDSLTALTLATLLAEIFEVEVTVGEVNNPANDLRRLADHIAGATRSAAGGPTFATVHGAGSDQVRASDLTLGAFLDLDTLDLGRLGAGTLIAGRATAAPLPAMPVEPARVVLLTGANGYLGRFLCLEWLERLAATGGTLVCVVRGADADVARARLAGAFDTDSELAGRFARLAAGRLEVLAGDLAGPALGLDEATWRRLAETVDLIVHAGALVNHLLPYEQLFAPNVAGTAELIRLALTGRLKRFSYVSTVGAVAGQASACDEDTDIRVASPVRALDGRYASGYAASKWAGEVLLRDAHERTGLPVAVFRPDLILAHTRYAGQLNPADVLTRLLVSLISTGLAPRTFDAPTDPAAGTDPAAAGDSGAVGGQARPAAAGLPVDVTAAAIAALGERSSAGHQTYNVVSPDDAAISLDRIVDLLIAAGCPITRIADHDDWSRRFETALRALPERRRNHSLLPLLAAFRRSGVAIGHPAIPADRFHAASREVGLGAPPGAAGLPALIGKYVADLRGLNLL